MKHFLFSLALSGLAISALAQNGSARLFLDLPSIYLAAPDVQKVGNLLGAGAETAFNVGTHWCVGRIGGGAVFSLDPKADDVGGSFGTNPYGLVEFGLGRYRSNGNQCAKTHQSAFTAMAKGGLRYNFEKDAKNPLEYTAGAELAYFFIRDMFKNNEIFLNTNYFVKSKVIGVNFGFKLFLNLKARRDY
ncbi:MAG: hypothetical protein KGS48_06485 [Bacteroidetes bacterium]|nr:hypothetical protein [Bacteroidota bacterium]